ncbi:MAG: chemotaxis protein CheW [Myxococcota bacterium]
MLIFLIDEHRYCIDARAVESVVAWREPTELPGGHQRIWGVLQDRGRVITIVRHPFPDHRSPVHSDERPLRTLVTPTSAGHIGVVASQTFEIEALSLGRMPAHGATLETTRGPATLIECESIASEIVATKE